MENPESTGSVVDDCPACSQAIDISSLPPFAQIQCPECNATVRMRRTMGQYYITGLLGEGGMSQVFKATDVHLQREVALKILHQSLSLDESLTAMFEREAKLTASILHPNVVKVYTVGRDQGYFFIAMEIIEARSLEQLISTKGCLPERDVLRIAHDVTSGLKAAYEEGLIHRDIKPGNMLVMDDGTTKLVDFGLAVHQDGEDESEELWATPFYVPPEKLDGETDSHLGDIYSLGATLYHAVAGKPPFEANTSSMDELKEIKKQTLNLKAEAPSLSKATLKLIDGMMAYRPEDRILSYDGLLESIEEIEAKQFGATSRERSAAKNSQVPKILWGGGAVIAAVIAIIFVVIKNQDTVPEDGLGISAEERVISKGDNSNTGKFLEGRDWIIAGNFRKAEPIFDELTGETGMASATRMWSLYFQGLSRLFLGRELEARESFGYIEAVPDAEGAEMDQIRDFMERSARAFSDPLPIVDAEEVFAGSDLRALGLLTAGVKNWQQGEFESAIRLFESYKEAGVLEDFAWVSELQSSVADFEEDWKILQTLPNPSRKEKGSLGAVKKTLEEVSGKFQSAGAADQLVKSRLARIDEIREAEKVASQPPKEPVVAMRPEPEKVKEDPEPERADGALAPEEEADRQRLLDSLASAVELQSSLQFAEAAALIAAAEVSSVRGGEWQSELQYAYGRAGEFIGMLATELESAEYEGSIHRREGVALDARITSATPSFFVVDLGFGPNEVTVDQFAPDWLVEAAEELLGEAAPARVEDWERLIYFSLATQQPEEADRLADIVSELSEDFAARWEKLLRLRSG